MEAYHYVYGAEKALRQGIFKNQSSTVTSLISRDEFYAAQSEAFVEEAFSVPCPAFLAAFTRHKKLTEADIQELQELIDRSRR